MIMNIVVVDDDRLVALSLKTILENTGRVSVTALGYSGEEGIELYEKYRPDVLLMDIRMQGMSGLEAAEKILSSDKNARILFLTTFSDDEYIVKAFKLGAKGYILKQDFNGIEPALAAVMNGQCVFGDTVMNRLPELIGKDKEPDHSAFGLSDREWEIIRLIAEFFVKL